MNTNENIKFLPQVTEKNIERFYRGQLPIFQCEKENADTQVNDNGETLYFSFVKPVDCETVIYVPQGETIHFFGKYTYLRSSIARIAAV